MADRGRDFKTAFIADTDKFDLGPVADQLEDVADSSKDATDDLEKTRDELKRLAAEGKDAEQELARLNAEVADAKFDEFGKDAKDAADKVDRAFDSIAKSAKTNMAKVEHEMEDAADEGFGEFKDEAKSSGKESAASFSGEFSDVGDTLQEIAANAFAGFGPLGLAAGIAAAAGIGIITKMFGDAKEKAEETKESIRGFYDSIVEGQGRISSASVAGRLDDILGDTDKFKEIKDQAAKAGVSVVTYAKALAGSATDAAELRRQQTEAVKAIQANATNTDISTAAQVEAQKALEDTGTAQAEVNRQVALATEQANVYQQATEGTTQADAAHALAMEDIAAATEAATAKESARVATVEEVRAAVEEAGKAEVTRKDGTVKSIDEIIAAQAKEITAKQNFLSNTREVFKEVGQAGVDWANSFGPLAPQMMQKLADAPKAKQAEIIKQYNAIGKLAGAKTAEGVTASAPAMATAAAKLHQTADAELAALGKLNIKVGVEGANISREAQLAWLELQRYYERHPVTIPVKPGKRPVVDVP